MTIHIPYLHELYLYLEDTQHVQKQTQTDYHKVLSSFYRFLQFEQKNYLEPINISSSDIRKYITYLLDEKQLKISTVNKHISKIKGYFDFLERIGKVGVDPAAKLKRLPNQNQRKWIPIQQIQEIEQQVISDMTINPLDKAIIILASNGVRTAQMSSEDFIDSLSFKNNQVTVNLNSFQINITGIAASYITELFHETEKFRSLFGTKHLFFMRKNGYIDAENQYSPMKTIDFSPKVNRLSRKIGISFTLKAIEQGFVFHKLDTYGFKNVNELQKHLGLNDINFRSILDAYKLSKTE